MNAERVGEPQRIVSQLARAVASTVLWKKMEIRRVASGDQAHGDKADCDDGDCGLAAAQMRGHPLNRVDVTSRHVLMTYGSSVQLPKRD
jgi:hypothetical protein